MKGMSKLGGKKKGPGLSLKTDMKMGKGANFGKAKSAARKSV